MQTHHATKALFCLSFISILASVCFTSCEKSMEPRNGSVINGKKKNPPPPPPPPPFYFNNCSNPTMSGQFVPGTAANVTFTLNYINSPGGPYPAFTSATINGITVTTPAGTLNVGTGSITFTATGTPLDPGQVIIPISIGGSSSCHLLLTVSNTPPPGPCSDPAATVGSLGCVTFTYQGQQVNYWTVRAADGKVWLRQNLGSPSVAINLYDQASFGHYFQWGRWDDGHQVPNSSTIAGSASLQNPSHIPSGNPNFITGTTSFTSWWANGTSSDSWSGTVASSTNGKDPCAAIGAGWHLPTSTELINVINAENIGDAEWAFRSNLKLPTSGYRHRDGNWYPNWTGGYYQTRTAGANGTNSVLFFDEVYNVDIRPIERGFGVPCRCVKD